MSLEEDRAGRRQGFLDWNVEERLPGAIGDYRFCRLDRQEGRIYYAFAYVSESTGWSVCALFDEETMDYMVKTDFRLFVITDIELITGDFEAYKKSVGNLLEKNMRKELLERENISVVVRGRAFTRWDFQEALPERIGNYERMVAPDRPIRGLNGSYIIAVYENRETERGIVFFYNMYRGDYYAEMTAKKIPIILHSYDSVTVEKLQAGIKNRLAKDLEKLDAYEPEA